MLASKLKGIVAIALAVAPDLSAALDFEKHITRLNMPIYTNEHSVHKKRVNTLKQQTQVVLILRGAVDYNKCYLLVKYIRNLNQRKLAKYF